ncbi:hypothetical protein D3C72_1152840 [compost metagenome]
MRRVRDRGRAVEHAFDMGHERFDLRFRQAGEITHRRRLRRHECVQLRLIGFLQRRSIREIVIDRLHIRIDAGEQILAIDRCIGEAREVVERIRDGLGDRRQRRCFTAGIGDQNLLNLLRGLRHAVQRRLRGFEALRCNRIDADQRGNAVDIAIEIEAAGGIGAQRHAEIGMLARRQLGIEIGHLKLSLEDGAAHAVLHRQR